MNDELHLGDFTQKIGTDPIPNYYGDALVSLARNNSKIVALTGDLTPATQCDLFRDTFPERFFNSGIAEANMIGLAAGMARVGDIPFVHSFSVFLTRRAYDQIAMQIAYPCLNVKLAGFLPGLTTLLGVSHQSIDDFALMRALPNMTIIEPSGANQMAAALRSAASIDSPVYLRLHKATKIISEREVEQEIQIGKGQLISEGDDAIIFACGHMVSKAQDAARMLKKMGITVAVANMHTLKPFDTDFVLKHANRTGVVVSAENHSIIGGLGSAISEALAERQANTHIKFKRVGVLDTFAEGGSTSYLFNKYGLSAQHIFAAISELLK